MKKSRIRILWSFILFSSLKSQSQYSINSIKIEEDSNKTSIQSTHVTNIQALTVGDKIPDYYLEELFNYKKDKAYLYSEFKGKYLILDFWATFCAPCIAKFPELNLIQEKFSDDLNILTIGIDGPGSGTIERYIEFNKGTKRQLNLPTAIIKNPLNSDFVKYFPFTNLPHEVWIDPNGYIIAITGAQAVTEKNVHAVVKGNRLPFEEKKMLRNVDFLETFLVNSPRSSKSRAWGSAISRYNDSLFTYNPLSLQDTSVFHLTILNQTQQQLYASAYDQIAEPWLNGQAAKKMIIDETTHIPLYYRDFPRGTKMDNWEFKKLKENSLYCYELILPKNYSKYQIYSSMVSDLDTYFNLKSYPAEVKLKCLVLSRKENKNSINIISTDNKSSDITDTDSTISYLRQPISFIIDQLNFSYLYSPLIIDETGITEKVSITVPKLASLDELKNKLREYDLDLVEKEKVVKVLLVKKL